MHRINFKVIDSIFLGYAVETNLRTLQDATKYSVVSVHLPAAISKQLTPRKQHPATLLSTEYWSAL